MLGPAVGHPCQLPGPLLLQWLLTGFQWDPSSDRAQPRSPSTIPRYGSTCFIPGDIPVVKKREREKKKREREKKKTMKQYAKTGERVPVSFSALLVPPICNMVPVCPIIWRDSGHSGQIKSFGWPGNTLVFPWKS